MATYNDPDDFLNKSLVDFGVGTGKEPIRDNLRATNGAAFRTEAAVGEARKTLAAIATRQAAIQEDVERAVTIVLHQPEFDGWQQVTRDMAKTVAAQGVLLAQIAEKLGLTKPVDPPPPVPPPALTYTVVAGDTLGKIAAKFGVTIADLVAWNSLADPNTIAVGQVLKVSAPKA